MQVQECESKLTCSPDSIRSRLGNPAPLTHFHLWGFSWGRERNRGPFRGLRHSMWIPLGHSANHAAPCYGCDPELAKEPLPGKCPACRGGIHTTELRSESWLSRLR